MGTRKSRAVAQHEVEVRPSTSRGASVGSNARPRPVRAAPSVSAAPVSLSSAVAQLPLRFAPPLTTLPALPEKVAHEVSSLGNAEQATLRPSSVRERFGELRALLSDGWEIVQPIFARPLWNVTDDSTTAFNFVLRRERTTRLLTVPEGRTVERFIRERQLTVDYRR